MDRAEAVAALRQAYEQGGMELLAAIADDIRVHGPLHDPEWILCLDCGHEFERPQASGHNAGRHPIRCPTCHAAEKLAQHRRYDARLKENRQ